MNLERFPPFFEEFKLLQTILKSEELTLLIIQFLVTFQDLLRLIKFAFGIAPKRRSTWDTAYPRA
jgi:hypothetical protein